MIKLRTMKLGRLVLCTKISPSSNLGVIDPTPGSPHLKMWRFAESLSKKSTNRYAW